MGRIHWNRGDYVITKWKATDAKYYGNRDDYVITKCEATDGEYTRESR